MVVRRPVPVDFDTQIHTLTPLASCGMLSLSSCVGFTLHLDGMYLDVFTADFGVVKAGILYAKGGVGAAGCLGAGTTGRLGAGVWGAWWRITVCDVGVDGGRA
jgi:hypothetical protein